MNLILLALLGVLSDFLRRRLFHVNEAQQRWGLVLIPIMLIWALSVMFVVKAIEEPGFTSPVRLEIGIGIVAISGLAFVWSMYRWLLKADEMIRKVETEALALGLGLGLLGFLVFNQLIHSGHKLSGILEPVSAPIGPFVFGYVLARFIIYLRYR
jgi:hypothetical protein